MRLLRLRLPQGEITEPVGACREALEPGNHNYMMRGGAFDEKGIWKPDNRGLGFWLVAEWINVHGKLHIVVPHREEYLGRYMTEDMEKFHAA